MSESVFDPAEYIRGFSDEQIVDHLDGVLTIVEKIIDLQLAHFEGSAFARSPGLIEHVFDVAQAMRATMQRRESPVEVPKTPLMTVPRGKR